MFLSWVIILSIKSNLIMFKFDKSVALLNKSKQYFTNGEGSSGRTALYPIYVDHAKGSRLFDVDGNEFIDFMLGYGPLILGHCHPRVVKSISEQAQKQLVHGCCHELELDLCRKIVSLIPSIEQIKLNVTGTEAVQAAVRLARAYTGRSKVIKFMGNYHGWIDNLLISGAATKPELMGRRNAPNSVLISKGQPESVLSDILVSHFNDIDRVEELILQNPGEIAAILTEPMMTNAHIIPPKEGFLAKLKALASKHGILLIFDEVVSGFRVAMTGGQGYYGVEPDITVFGKALGGGLPISAVGASTEIMKTFVDGGAIHLGTFNSNSLAVAAANAALDELMHDVDAFRRMNRLGQRLQEGIVTIFSERGIPVRTQGTESLFATMFTESPVDNFADTFNLDKDLLSRFKRGLYDRGIMVRPEARDIWYLSTAHTDADIDQCLEILLDIAKEL
jgi:glutamate-1-semialdehyde 2,1-aminomutase